VNLDLVGTVRELPRQLVGYPAQLLLEYLTTHSLIHRHATRSSGSPVRLASIVAFLTGCGEGRCLEFT
jgi:hypothetical protein